MDWSQTIAEFIAISCMIYIFPWILLKGKFRSSSLSILLRSADHFRRVRKIAKSDY